MMSMISVDIKNLKKSVTLLYTKILFANQIGNKSIIEIYIYIYVKFELRYFLFLYRNGKCKIQLIPSECLCIGTYIYFPHKTGLKYSIFL